MKKRPTSVPDKYKSFYQPINAIKIMLTKQVALSSHDVANGLSFIHFASFLILESNRSAGISSNQTIAIRKIAELTFKPNGYQFTNTDISQLTSFVDKLAKLLNTTQEYLLHIYFYDAYLNAEIYRHFHQDLDIFSNNQYL